ncbi:MAG: ECF transporter S component [Candidatus Bathyarchaeia archaeon]
MLKAKDIAVTCIFTALVCIATISFTIYVPSTRGYFNIGETMIYVAALLFGPLIGGVSGGLGSMFADLLLGYYHYAPATLVIKAIEGFVVGFISRKGITLASKGNKRSWQAFSIASGILTGSLIVIVGSVYYSGYTELYSSIISAETPTMVINIPIEFWLGLGITTALLISIFALTFEPKFGLTIISCISGGLLMVLGYFLYEQFFLGVFALAEVPINMGQMIIGLIVATPIVKIVGKAIPQVGSCDRIKKEVQL